MSWPCLTATAGVSGAGAAVEFANNKVIGLESGFLLLGKEHREA